MPIIPYLTDQEENLEELCQQAKKCEVDYLLPGTLYLRGPTRVRFFDFMQKEYPALTEHFKELYKTGSAGKTYDAALYQVVNRLRSKYDLSSSYMKPMRDRLTGNKLSN